MKYKGSLFFLLFNFYFIWLFGLQREPQQNSEFVRGKFSDCRVQDSFSHFLNSLPSDVSFDIQMDLARSVPENLRNQQNTVIEFGIEKVESGVAKATVKFSSAIKPTLSTIENIGGSDIPEIFLFEVSRNFNEDKLNLEFPLSDLVELTSEASVETEAKKGMNLMLADSMMWKEVCLWLMSYQVLS